MTLQVFSTNSIGTGVRATLGSSDDAYIDAGILVASTDQYAIYGSGSDQSVIVEGRVVGTGVGISLGNDSSVSHGERVILGNDGYVSGSAAQSIGIYLTGYDSTIENHGIIQGGQRGITLNGDSAVTTSTVVNDGEIYGGNQGITRSGSEDFKLVNNGLISTIDGYSYQGFDATGDQTVINNGRIVGGVYLGDGNDVYNGADGKIIDGTISGDFGNDTLIGGRYAEYLQGDQGRDVLTGGGGGDHFIFARIVDSTNQKSGQDLVTDFRHGQHDVLDFSTIDASDTGSHDAFKFLGSQGFSDHEGELRYSFKGSRTLVQGDTDGDGHADFTVALKGHLHLTAGDFLV